MKQRKILEEQNYFYLLIIIYVLVYFYFNLKDFCDFFTKQKFSRILVEVQ